MCQAEILTQARVLASILSDLGKLVLHLNPTRGVLYRVILQKFSEEVIKKTDVLVSEMESVTLQDWEMLAPTLEHLSVDKRRRRSGPEPTGVVWAKEAIKNKRVFDYYFDEMNNLIFQIRARNPIHTSNGRAGISAEVRHNSRSPFLVFQNFSE